MIARQLETPDMADKLAAAESRYSAYPRDSILSDPRLSQVWWLSTVWATSLNPEFRVSDPGFRVSDLEFRVSDLEFRVSDLKFRVSEFFFYQISQIF